MKHKQSTNDYPNFSEFVVFVQKQADIVNDPLYGKDVLEDRLVSSRGKKSVTSLPVVTQTVGSSISYMDSSAQTIANSPSSQRCHLCSKNHKLYACYRFKSMPIDKRLDYVKTNKLCTLCFSKDHLMSECRSSYICRINNCGGKHSSAIHLHDSQPPTVAGHCVQSCENSNVYMPTLPVTINGTFRTFALLDTGSSTTFCTRRLMDKLKLQGTKLSYQLQTLHGSMDNCSEVVHFEMSSEDGTESLSMNNVLVVDTIPVEEYSLQDVQSYPHIKDITFSRATQVDILIGQDNPAALVPIEVRRGPADAPFATRTLMGWSLNGRSPMNVASHAVTSHFISTTILDKRIDRLWELEEIGMPQDVLEMSIEDERVIKLWDQECTVVNGHFQLPIPWKGVVPVMPDNLNAARSRLDRLYASLTKRSMVEQYDEQIRNMVAQGYAEQIMEPQSDKPDKCWYLPTHSVSKRDGHSLRIVFDCAHVHKGTSLNGSCLQGPNLSAKLFDVLLKFRQYPHAVIGDIKSMYNQVKIPPDDRDALRFLWIRDSEVLHFRSTSHLFGGVWCASSASYALQRTARDTNDSELQDMIMHAFYVDDLAYSSLDANKLSNQLHSLKRVLIHRGFHLRKFTSNTVESLSMVPVDDQLVTEDSASSLQAVLGLGWNVSQDVLVVKIDPKKVSTKSQMLSSLASIYDPLGLISPLLVQGKLLFQETVKGKIPWDGVLPLDIQKRWERWLENLSKTTSFVTPRCLIPADFADASCELHCFNDASQQAYGCCIYLRCTNKEGRIHTLLIASKVRICPISGQTIPRLELQSAVLSVKLEESIRSALTIPLLKSTFWTDSKIVLAYVKNETRRFSVFVSNRVRIIRKRSCPEDWKHIPGVDNPADALTRPIVHGREDDDVWRHGPAILRTHKSEWKIAQTSTEETETLPLGIELVKPKVITLSAEVVSNPIDVLINHYSDWDRLIRAVSWLLKFKQALIHKETKFIRALQPEDLQVAERAVINYVQQRFYSGDIARTNNNLCVSKNSVLRKLNPKIDQFGTLVIGGRIIHSKLQYSQKLPIIIPHDSHVSTLIVRSFHNRCHLGREWLFSLLRKRFWITKARRVIYQVSKDCVTCKKLFAIALPQKMADLPPTRVQPSERPFTHLGLDVFGPFIVKRGRHELKRYGCIFVCFNVRAIHIEMLDDLESDTFINALRRFMARRGTPSSIFSDNATNFRGAESELRKSIAQSNSSIHAFCTTQSIKWTFNVPTASHMGGVYERMIRTVRKVLVGMLIESARLTDDILRTFFCEAESIVNSRPLTKMSDDPNDDLPLTPAHFLMTGDGPDLSIGQFSIADKYRRRWRYIQHLTDVFWRRYVNQYIPELQRRQRWTDNKPNFKIGDLALLVDENTPRRLWPLGLVVDVNMGRDELVRSVRVKTRSTELVRPITKLVALEC